jgi:hypothetical protein
MYSAASKPELRTSVTFVRVIVTMLVVGVIAVGADAQALACEFVCASPQAGALSHEHGAKLGHHATPLHHEGHSEHSQPAAAPHNHGGQAAPETGQLQQCVTVNDVSLQAGASRSDIDIVPLVTIAISNQFGLGSIINRSSVVAVAGSPPARNGPLQTSSVLRI